MPAPAPLRRALVRLAAFLLCTVAAFAHNAFESSTVLRLRGDALELEVVMARTSAAQAAIPGSALILLSPENFETYRAELIAGASNVFTVSSPGGILQPREATVVLTDEQDVIFLLRYTSPTSGKVRFTATHLAALGADYSSAFVVARLGQPATEAVILTTSYPDIEVTIGGTEQLASATPPAGFRAFLVLGVEHILTGYDHLLFLCGLLVVCRRFGSMAGVITCFTLAHSMTLALAALSVFAVPSRIVEPLIAASIIYVGVENLVRRGEPPGRWALTFAFGLIHGFGFAGVLREIGLGAGGAPVAIPLFAFNVGVEFGQLAVMAVLLPILLWWRKRPVYERIVQPAVSWIVVGAGVCWLLQRTLFS